MSKHEVIVGDGEWEKKETPELREVNYGKDHRWFISDTEFDGHHTLWGFEYFPTTYLKSSELSGDEWRKGGEIRYYRDRKLVYTQFCREPHIAVLKIGETLLKLQGFAWEHLEEGRKVWFEQTPAVIERVLWEQGCVILKTEDGSDFPEAVWSEDGSGERGKTVKVEFISESIFWWRK